MSGKELGRGNGVDNPKGWWSQHSKVVEPGVIVEPFKVATGQRYTTELGSHKHSSPRTHNQTNIWVVHMDKNSFWQRGHQN